MSEVELAWAAGFFDGEGSVGIVLQIKQNARPDGSCPDTLERFQAAVGGHIGGPYVDRPTRRGFSPRRRPSYTWWSGRGEVDDILALLWPYLGEAKRADAQRHRELAS